VKGKLQQVVLQL